MTPAIPWRKPESPNILTIFASSVSAATFFSAAHFQSKKPAACWSPAKDLSEAEMQRIIANDPAVQSGLIHAKLHRWFVTIESQK
jgi:hypothetical protein